MLCRRAKALVALGRPEEGLQDLNLAHTILPLNPQIQTDRDNLKKLILEEVEAGEEIPAEEE